MKSVFMIYSSFLYQVLSYEMNMISQQAQRTPLLPTQRDAGRIRALEKEGIKVWKLQQGDPQFATPESVYTQLKSYQETTLGYPGAAGLPDHVAAWKASYARQGIEADLLHIIPTCGAAEAIHMALFTVTDPGDEVLVVEPIYSGFSVIASILGCHLIPVRTTFENQFQLPPNEAWEAKLTLKTKALILINPDNPTGRVLSRQELERMARFAYDHQLILIVDETYRDLFLQEHIDRASALLLNSARESLILIDSLSKRAGVPGMRIGVFVTYQKQIADQALKFAMSRSGTSRIEQRISIPLLTEGEALVKRNHAELQSRIDAALEALRDIPNLLVYQPQGGMFVVVKIPGVNAKELLTFFLEEFRFNGETVSFLSLQDFYPSNDQGIEEIRLAAIYPAEQMKHAIEVFACGIEAFRVQRHIA